MKYFIDTEFLEGPQKKRFMGVVTGWTPPTIDLISIGIISEDGREYYAISKDFNLKEAWNRCDVEHTVNPNYEPSFLGWKDSNLNPMYFTKKTYWIRENVLMPIHYELAQREVPFALNFDEWKDFITYRDNGFYHDRHYKTLKKLINKHGISNNQIADEVDKFCLDEVKISKVESDKYVGGCDPVRGKPEFYAYYADYDWVVFCWLFGNMINLPKGFPMYCKDLKQIMDERAELITNKEMKEWFEIPSSANIANPTLEDKVRFLKGLPKYPVQLNEHNALADAKWNRNLYEFLKAL